jgi:hypothetical protein
MRRRASRQPGRRPRNPSTRTEPAVGRMRPSISLNSVLLPAPLWPIRPNSWPRGTDRLDAVHGLQGAEGLCTSRDRIHCHVIGGMAANASS